MPGCHGVAPGAAGLTRIRLDTSLATGFNLAGPELPSTGRGDCTGIVSGSAQGRVLQVVASTSFSDSVDGAVLHPDAVGTINSNWSEHSPGNMSEGGRRPEGRAGNVAKKSPSTRCFGPRSPTGGDGSPSRLRWFSLTSEDACCAVVGDFVAVCVLCR